MSFASFFLKKRAKSILKYYIYIHIYVCIYIYINEHLFLDFTPIFFIYQNFSLSFRDTYISPTSLGHRKGEGSGDEKVRFPGLEMVHHPTWWMHGLQRSGDHTVYIKAVYMYIYICINVYIKSVYTYIYITPVYIYLYIHTYLYTYTFRVGWLGKSRIGNDVYFI